ncbi:hypothetical protein [Plasmodium yoelii yoelii]|uniref:Uncharacterized protein n=1 Tax=Plasmodium yoelii yoelii TaxID=73239 RepID=Q7RQR9_PLAYO|nr:hypothetical protein [Plasmodium yoelii yoelii]
MIAIEVRSFAPTQRISIMFLCVFKLMIKKKKKKKYIKAIKRKKKIEY